MVSILHYNALVSNYNALVSNETILNYFDDFTHHQIHFMHV